MLPLCAVTRCVAVCAHVCLWTCVTVCVCVCVCVCSSHLTSLSAASCAHCRERSVERVPLSSHVGTLVTCVHIHTHTHTHTQTFCAVSYHMSSCYRVYTQYSTHGCRFTCLSPPRALGSCVCACACLCWSPCVCVCVCVCVSVCVIPYLCCAVAEVFTQLNHLLCGPRLGATQSEGTTQCSLTPA